MVKKFYSSTRISSKKLLGQKRAAADLEKKVEEMDKKICSKDRRFNKFQKINK